MKKNHLIISRYTEKQMSKLGVKREKSRNRLLMTENKRIVTRGVVGGGMGKIGEEDYKYTYLDEH